MRRITLFLLTLLGLVVVTMLVVFFVQSRARKPSDIGTNRLKVAASIFPAYDILRMVGGDAIDPILMLPPGANPHGFEPTPSDIFALKDASVFFLIGQDIDTWADGLIPAHARKVYLDAGITLQPFALFEEEEHEEEEDEHAEGESIEGEEAHEDEHDHGPLDPHYWLDPDNAVLMAESIALALGKELPDKATYFTDRAQEFETIIEELDGSLKEALKAVTIKPIVPFHDAFGYFTTHYEIPMAATIEPFPGKEPTPQYVAEIKKKVEEHDVQALFIQPQLSREVVDSLAKDLNIRVGVLDDIGGVAGRNTYAELLTFNIQSIIQAHQN